MANYTEHYQLHQWEPSDSFLRTDFNQDFARIDTGIRAAKAQAERLEQEKADIEAALCSGTLGVEELTEKSKRLPELNDLIDEKTMRWLELSEIEG